MMPTAEWARETGQWKDIVHPYLACVAFIDHYVGRVLETLRTSPYADNTVVVLWSDHGYHLGEKNRFAKHSLWERATHVPLIIAGPGVKDNATCARPVALLDLYPTLLELCGLPANPQHEGNSLTPLLEAPDAPWPHVARTTYGPGNHAVSWDGIRYLVYEDGSEEIYDGRNGPNEWYNLAGEAAWGERVAPLRALLPKCEATWSPLSRLTVNTYFRALQQGVSSE